MKQMKIIFALSRWHYNSYHDWRELIRVTGFETCFLDEIDLSAEAVYIFSPFNAEIRYILDNNREKTKRAKLVWYCLERPHPCSISSLVSPGAGVYSITKSGDIPDYVDEVWIGDQGFANGLDSNRVRFVPVGSHPDLCSRDRPNRYHYNFVTLSYDSPRRQKIFGALETQGNLRKAPNAWSPMREDILSQTQVMLNVHQDEHKIQEPLRLAIAAVNRIPVVSETIEDPYPLEANVDYISLEPHLIPIHLPGILKEYSPELLKKLSDSLYNKLCVQFRFDENIKKAAEAVWG